MKKSLLLLVVLFVSVASSRASVTVRESTDSEYLINSGYSQILAEDVFVEKNRVTGKPIEPLYDKQQNPLIRFGKRLYGYFDPSIDEADRLHHDIKLSPSYSDL